MHQIEVPVLLTSLFPPVCAGAGAGAGVGSCISVRVRLRLRLGLCMCMSMSMCMCMCTCMCMGLAFLKVVFKTVVIILWQSEIPVEITNVL